MPMFCRHFPLDFRVQDCNLYQCGLCSELFIRPPDEFGNIVSHSHMILSQARRHRWLGKLLNFVSVHSAQIFGKPRPEGNPNERLHQQPRKADILVSPISSFKEKKKQNTCTNRHGTRITAVFNHHAECSISYGRLRVWKHCVLQAERVEL